MEIRVGINLSVGVLTMVGCTSAQAQNPRPNIIFILADDFGWNDLGCMGSRYYETPNLDRLSRQGVLFTNAYAACQVSSPSRASILTGKYPTGHGITNWIGEKSGEEWRQLGRQTKLLPADYCRQLPAEEYTLAECLKDNGYDTFFAGKWHLGDEGSWPEDHGFDINIGGWTAGSPTGGYFPPYKNPKITDEVPAEQLSMRLSRQAAAYIAQHNQSANNRPFFAYLSFYAVHGPIQTTKAHWEHFRDKADSIGIKPSGFAVDRTLPVRQSQDNPVYAGLVRQMDDAIGYLLDEVERLGIAENTIIVFTSDNGGVTSGDGYSTSLLPLRGGKGRQWEGGLRVPMMIRTPNSKKIVCDRAVSGIDLYPTLMDLAGVSYRAKQQVDGVSLKPLLSGDDIKARPLFWHYPHYGNQGGEPSSVVREGD